MRHPPERRVGLGGRLLAQRHRRPRVPPPRHRPSRISRPPFERVRPAPTRRPGQPRVSDLRRRSYCETSPTAAPLPLSPSLRAPHHAGSSRIPKFVCFALSVCFLLSDPYNIMCDASDPYNNLCGISILPYRCLPCTVPMLMIYVFNHHNMPLWMHMPLLKMYCHASWTEEKQTLQVCCCTEKGGCQPQPISTINGVCCCKFKPGCQSEHASWIDGGLFFRIGLLVQGFSERVLLECSAKVNGGVVFVPCHPDHHMHM